MTPNIENASSAELAALGELDALMSTLPLDESAEIVEEIEQIADLDDLETVEPMSADAVLDEDDLADLDIQVDKAEAYAGQSATATGDAESEATITAPAGKKSRKAAGASTTPKTPATPRASKDLNTIDAVHFQLALTGNADDAHKAAVLASIPTQVKIAEKFENLFQAISVGKLPSRYTVEAFKVLFAKKTMSSADLIAAYKGIGLGDGTARSQCGQMMNLFDALGIAKRSGKDLTLCADSTIAAYLIGKLALV